MVYRRQVIAIWAFSLATVSFGKTPPDEMCAKLADFAKATADTRVHTVTLLTDWNLPEATRACQRPDEQAEIKLCNWLLENSSTEFMTVNIDRVLSCAGLVRSQPNQKLYIEALAGKVRSIRPSFTSMKIALTVEFDSSPKDALPWLSVTVGPTDE
jgi:hypothetical protein